MNLQGRNLSIDMQGDDVKLLHSELIQIGFEIPVDELAGKMTLTRFLTGTSRSSAPEVLGI